MARTKLSQELLDEPVMDNKEPESKKAKKEPTMTDKDIYDSVIYLKEMVTNEMNRRKKAGEKWRQLSLVVGNMVVLTQNVRKLSNLGFSPRIAR